MDTEQTPKRKPGRPALPTSATPAQRQRAYRTRLAAKFLDDDEAAQTRQSLMAAVVHFAIRLDAEPNDTVAQDLLAQALHGLAKRGGIERLLAERLRIALR